MDEPKYQHIPDGVAREIPPNYGGGGGGGSGGRNENELIKINVKVPDRDHVTRELKFRIEQGDLALRAQRQENGRLGDTVHRLRAELAEAQAINGKIARGELRMLERLIAYRDDTIKRLRGKLADALVRNVDLAEQVVEWRGKSDSLVELRERLAAKLQAAEDPDDPPDPHLWAAQHEAEKA